uniref:Sm domain-containing protein n=1 Tax=Ascaris lumbricoides TaxID=6252 RepID=A0A0M3IX79_ASCLU
MGFFFQPWSELNFHILTDAVLNKTIAVVDKITGNVITCGKITIKGKLSDWESAKNRSNVLMSSIWCILLIFPWSELNFHILTDAVLNKTIAVVDKITGNVITCGKITIKGKLSDWESAKNRSNVLMSSIWCILLIFVYLLR